MRKKTAKRHPARTAGATLRERWSAAVASLRSTQREMEKQVSHLLKKNRITSKEARAVLKDLSTRFERQRKNAAKELEGRLTRLQARVKKERKAAGRMVQETVQRALAALNIPNRQEISELTRKVDDLSKKIDAFAR